MWGIEAQFIEPAPIWRARPVYSFGGSTLVVRSRSEAGRTRRDKHAERLRSVHLDRIDAACVVDASKGNSVYGNVFRSQALCRFHELPLWLPPGPLELSIFGDGTMMYREEFGDSKMPGEIVVVGDGEYVQVETVEDRLFVSWSTVELPSVFMRGAAERLHAKFDDSAEAGFLQLAKPGAAGDEAEGSPHDILEFLEVEHPAVGYLRLTLADGTRIAWNEVAPRLTTSTYAYAEVSVDCTRSHDRGSLLALIAGTGTPELEKRVDALASDIRQFVS